MPRTNTSGIKVTCPHCGHTWFYTGSNPVTSCPNPSCRYRVRVAPTQREVQQENRELIPTHRNNRGGLI